MNDQFRVIGIDVSTKAIAVVMLDAHSRLRTYTTLMLPTLASRHPDAVTRRLAAIQASDLLDGLCQHATLVAIEDPMTPMNIGTAKTLGQIVGAVASVALRHLEPELVQLYRPEEWKAAAGLPGRAVKPEIAQLALTRWPDIASAASQDIYDAACIALAALRESGRGAEAA